MGIYMYIIDLMFIIIVYNLYVYWLVFVLNVKDKIWF